MSLRKILGAGLAVAKVVPVWGPMIAAMIPGKKDDAIIQRATDTLFEVEGVVVSLEATGTLWKDKGITGEDKMKASGPLVAAIILRSMKAAGRKLDGADEAKFIEACGKLGGAYADIMDCFDGD